MAPSRAPSVRGSETREVHAPHACPPSRSSALPLCPTPGLLKQLRQRLDSLPEAQRAVLEDPRAAVAATAEQLAQQAVISMPAMVRTCRSFGYDSVRESMLALAQDLAVPVSYLHRRVLAEDSAQDISSKIIHAAVSSLAELGRRIDCYSVDGASTFTVSELQSRLFRLGLTANAIVDAHQQLASASTLGPEGVAFVVSHVGRMPYTVEAPRFARSQGATAIALTQPGTPLAVSVPQDAVMRVGTEAYPCAHGHAPWKRAHWACRPACSTRRPMRPTSRRYG